MLARQCAELLYDGSSVGSQCTCQQIDRHRQLPWYQLARGHGVCGWCFIPIFMTPHISNFGLEVAEMNVMKGWDCKLNFPRVNSLLKKPCVEQDGIKEGVASEGFAENEMKIKCVKYTKTCISEKRQSWRRQKHRNQNFGMNHLICRLDLTGWR